jgi:DNA-binding SARP family transcriptional activator/tRNA A-37 threonylcarbamoyl transferase component Bud32
MHYRVLGPIGVERDGLAVGVGGPQQRRLLAVLLVQRGQPVNVDRLVDALWPDEDPPDGAARSVMTYVSRLRASLGEAAVLTTGAGYLLDVTGASVDADEFVALIERAEQSLPDEALGLYEQALAAWRGEPFGEFTNEWWAVGESMRLKERRVLAREERAACLLAMGHPRRAIPDLEALTVDEPLRERPVHLLMSALHESGRTADALRSFQQFRTRLADDTGFDPSPGLVALERSMASDDAPSTTAAGRPLRGYTIHDVIGEGAFGRVYAATQPGTNRKVAIKAVRPDLADTTEFVIRFEAEAQLVARLEHPHIVPLYDYWREPGGAFLVFRLLGGGSVRESVIVGGPWSLARVDLLVDQVGSALLAAHAAGVVHGDVSARNVLLDDDGAAYLTDFGIAALHGASGGDARTDVADLARLVWEVLSGAPAPAGPLPSLVGKVDGDVIDGLDALLNRATVERGLDSMAEFLVGWQAVIDHAVPIGAGSSERRVLDSARRHQAERMTRDVAAVVNPYRGLQTFEEVDAGLFFGRGDVVASMLAEVAATGFVALVGASGSGKSSVVRAGLVPALRAQHRPVVTLVPGDHPAAALAAARREVATAGSPGRWPAGVVVVVDQFEELWTRAEAVERGTFLDELLGGLAAVPGAAVVVALRADLLDGPLLDARTGPLLSAGSTLLAPLTPAQLEEAISLPAQRVGVGIEPAAVATLVAEAAARPGSLPLLQFVLRELYDRRVDGVMHLDALEQLGGLTGAVGRRADEVFDALDDEGRSASRTLFARLLVPAGGSVGVACRSPNCRQSSNAPPSSTWRRACCEPTATPRPASPPTRWPTRPSVTVGNVCTAGWSTIAPGWSSCTMSSRLRRDGMHPVVRTATCTAGRDWKPCSSLLRRGGAWRRWRSSSSTRRSRHVTPSCFALGEALGGCVAPSSVWPWPSWWR